MESEVEMVVFINPHLFWISEISKEREGKLAEISEMIRGARSKIDRDKCQIDDMVSVQFEGKFFRATIEDIVADGFFCWLVDVGKLIDCDIVFKLPNSLKNIPIQAKQASLYNLGYIKQTLDLGAYGGEIKSVPTMIPEPGVYHYAETLLDKNEKLVFQKKTEQDGVLYGDIIVHKNRRKFSLFEELAAKELIAENEEVFKRIQAGIPIYKKTHLRMIHQLTMTSAAPSKVDLKSEDQSCPYDDIEELIKLEATSLPAKFETMPDDSKGIPKFRPTWEYQSCPFDDEELLRKPLLNGRRLRAARDQLVSSSSTSSSESIAAYLTANSDSEKIISSNTTDIKNPSSQSEAVNRHAKLTKLLAKRRKTDDSSDFGLDTSTEDTQNKQTMEKIFSDRQTLANLQTKRKSSLKLEETDSSDLESHNTSTDTQNSSTDNYQNGSKMTTLNTPVDPAQKPSKISTLLNKLSTRTQCFEYMSSPQENTVEAPLKPVNENIEIGRDDDDKVSVSSFKISSLVKTIKTNKENKNRTKLPLGSSAGSDTNARKTDLEFADLTKNEKVRSQINYTTDEDTKKKSSKVSVILNNVRARKAASENESFTSQRNEGINDDIKSASSNSDLANLLTQNEEFISPFKDVTDNDTDNKSSKVSTILKNVRTRKANSEKLTRSNKYFTDDDTDNSSKVLSILKNARATKEKAGFAKLTDEGTANSISKGSTTENKFASQDDEGSEISCENDINSPKSEVLGIKFKIPNKKQSEPRVLPGNFVPAGYTVKTRAKRVFKTSSKEDDLTKEVKRKEGDASESHKSSAGTESESQREDTSEPIRPEPFCNNTKVPSFFQMHNCKCRECREAFEDDDWDKPVQFDDTVCKKKKAPIAANVPIIRPLKLLKPAGAENEPIENDIISINFAEMTRVKKQAFDKLLVHGDDIPTPVIQLSQTCLNKEILDDLRKCDYIKPMKIQKYAFPALTRNHHVFLIGDKGSGKTMSYLPTLYSFMLEKNERYRLLKDGGGPIAVILCSSSSKCELVYDYAKKIFSSRQRDVRLHLETYPGRSNTSNIDILITLPTVLLTLLNSYAINFKRLCHFVLEDGDVILDKDYAMVKDLLIRADKYLENRNCPKPIQMIVCAEHWTKNMETLLKMLNKTPLVCIGNHLEAALYGKVNFKMQFLNSASKEMELKKHLEDVHKFEKSVVICTDEQVNEIQTMFVLWGISCTAINNDMLVDVIVYLEDVWNRTPAGQYSVLVCTDYIYSTLLSVTSATLLIHYSMPKSWTQFIRRFSSLLENCSTPLNIQKRKPKITTLVLLDEKCQPHIAKIVYYLGTSSIKSYLPEVVKALFQNTKVDREEKKLSERVELCPTLKLFGECSDLACPNRHLIEKKHDVSEKLPQNGIIKFQIREVLDLSHFLIQIKEHYDLKRNKTEYGDKTEEIVELLSKSKRKPVSRPRRGHVYMYVDENKCRERVKLIEIKDEVLADVRFIDEGTYRKVKIDRLYKLSEELKAIPPQTIDVYLANLIPPYNDPTFSAKAYRKLKLILDEKDLLNSTMTAEIQLQLGNTLWLNDVVEEREMYDKSLPNMGYQLSREIVKMEMAELSKTQLSKLYQLCKNYDIELPEYEVQKEKKEVTVAAQALPQWAFLDIAGTNEVFFSVGVSPDEFYVRIKKFSMQLEQLQRDIQREIKRPMYPEVKKLVEGQCYLAPDEISGEYERVMIKEITEDGHAFCFFVDHGEEILIPTSQLKHISNTLITKLPFQSIQCRLVGVAPIDQEWSSSANDFLYDFGYTNTEPKQRKTLFLRVGTRDQNYVIERQKSYSVLIKGATGENKKLLNNLMIDCGQAIPNDEKVEDFIVAEPVWETEEEEVDEYESYIDGGEGENEHNQIVPYNHQTDQSQSVINEEEVEWNVFDAEALVNLLLPEEIINLVNLFGKATQNNNPVNDDVKDDNNDKIKDDNFTVPMKALPPVDYYTPTCLWSQTNKNVKLTIKLPDVIEYDVSVKSNGRIFHFSTHKDEKKYLLNILLFAKVENYYQHTALGLTVKVTLTKKEPGKEWTRLPCSTENFRHIHYDHDAIPIEEEKKQQIWTTISDDESDPDEQGCIYYLSDRDSEYDEDIPRVKV